MASSMQLFKTVSTDDFEVVVSATNVIPVSATNVIPKCAEKASETEPDAAQAQIDEIRRQFECLNKKSSDRSVTHDRRVRTLEYCFDDCEAEIQNIRKAVEQVKKQIDESPVKQEALDALRFSLEETKMLSRDNSTRLDRMIVRYLPSIEAKVQGIKLDQKKQYDQIEAAFHELACKLESVSPSELTDIRRVAAEANLRARSVDQRLPELKAELFMALAVELVAAQENARKDREDASRDVDRLSKDHMDMWTDSRDLSLKVKRVEEVAQHLTATVLPLLEQRLQQQQQLLSCKEAEIREVTNAAEGREALLEVRVQRLEERLCRENLHAQQDSEMQLRLAALEATVGSLSSVGKVHAMTQTSVQKEEINKVHRPLIDSIKAEVLRRAIQAELFKRDKRRHRMIARQFSASAMRAGALRIALAAEIRRRERRRTAPSAAAIRAACIRRELRVEIARRKEVQHRPSAPSAAVLRAACIRREIRVEIARRMEAQHRHSAPSAAVLRAACIRREIRVEIARRNEVLHRRNVPTVGTIWAACLRRKLRLEIARRQGKLRRLTAPSEAAIRAACIRREIRVEIGRRQVAVSRSRAGMITTSTLRAEILRRALVAEIARRKAASPATTAVSAKEAVFGTIEVNCKTLDEEIFQVQVPTFVSIRYLKQLIYFKGGCKMHPSTVNLVYAGRLLEDCWKVGGGLFTATPPVQQSDEFNGIQNEDTVLVLANSA